MLDGRRCRAANQRRAAASFEFHRRAEGSLRSFCTFEVTTSRHSATSEDIDGGFAREHEITIARDSLSLSRGIIGPVNQSSDTPIRVVPSPKLRSTIGDDSDPEIAANRRQMAEMIRRVECGALALGVDTFKGWEYDAAMAHTVIASARRYDNIVLSGVIIGDLVVSDNVPGHFAVMSDISGNLTVSGDVAGDLAVFGKVSGHLDVGGAVTGNLNVARPVGGNLIVKGAVGGILTVEGAVGGTLAVAGPVGGNLGVFGAVSGYLAVTGPVSGDLAVSGDVSGDLTVLGKVFGNLTVSGDVGGNLIVGSAVFGGVSGTLDVSGVVSGDLVAEAAVSAISVTGSVAGRTAITPREPLTRLLSVRGARLGDEVFIGDNVDISECDFRQCPDLDRFSLVGAHLFAGNPGGLTNPPADSEEIPALEMATIYRQLRTNLESRRNRASAGIFYTGEMNSRRAAAKRWSVEWWILSLYKAMSGYGLVARNAFVWFAVLVLAGAGLYYFTGTGFNPYEGEPSLDLFGTIQFSFESMLGLLRPPGDNLEFWERWLQVAQRIAGPVLVAQAVLAIRERVAR